MRLIIMPGGTMRIPLLKRWQKVQCVTQPLEQKISAIFLFKISSSSLNEYETLLLLASLKQILNDVDQCIEVIC